jgi:hypothetical protein
MILQPTKFMQRPLTPNFMKNLSNDLRYVHTFLCMNLCKVDSLIDQYKYKSKYTIGHMHRFFILNFTNV